MVVLDFLRNEVVGFLGIQGLVDLLRSGNYAELTTWKGLTSVIAPDTATWVLFAPIVTS